MRCVPGAMPKPGEGGRWHVFATPWRRYAWRCHPRRLFRGDRLIRLGPMAPRIALLGGSFDPIHCGHLIVARAVAERLDLDRVILLPAAAPPHKGADRLADPTHRAEMTRIAISDEPLFEMNDFDLTRHGPCYTIDTVEHFRDVLGPDAVIHWIIGADWLGELPNWHRACDLIDHCRIVTAQRPGGPTVGWSALQFALGAARTAAIRDGVVDTPMIDISSTDIRRRAAAGLSIRYLVPDSVAEYIHAHRLYE